MIASALHVVDGVDAALTAGFARLVPAQRDALGELAAALSGSPLGPFVSTAVAALGSGDLAAHHVVAVAAGRAALLGSVHDALLAEAGVLVSPAEVGPPPSIPAEHRARLDGVKQGLVEIALAGLAQLDAGLLAPHVPAIADLRRAPALARLAAVTTGLYDELLAHAPTSGLADLPSRRWADLWSRALLLTVALPDTPVLRPVQGTLHVLGVEPRHHDHLVSVVVHGVLDADGARRFVRVTRSAWKVGAISGLDAWSLVRPSLGALLDAGEGAAVPVTGTLSGVGGLEVTEVGAPVPGDPFGIDLTDVVVPTLAPRDRHPALLALPARGAGPAELLRVSPMLDFGGEVAENVLGLRRWDDGWALHPLVIRTKKGKLVGIAASLALAAKRKGDPRAILTERASRLLRAG